MKKLSENEALREERKKLKDLKGRKKFQYIWDYYKIPIIVILAVSVGLGSYIHTLVTEKDPVLFVSAVDFSFDVPAAEKLDTAFISDYLQLDPVKQEVTLGSESYLTEDDAENMNYQYAMAMQARLMGDLSSKRLDIVLMDQKGFEGFASEGYLMDLEAFLSGQDPKLLSDLQTFLTKADVIISDNRQEASLNEDIPYEAVTEKQIVGIDVSEWKIFSGTEVPSPLYLGVIGSTERTDEVLSYMHYLFEV